jgi:hypothetical protein
MCYSVVAAVGKAVLVEAEDGRERGVEDGSLF